jgi:hypothetical protein
LQDEETERRSLSSIPYDADIHKLNPFLGKNATAQAVFARRAPDLATFYREEAKPVQIPVFGAKRNLTVEGKLYRDPETAAIVKVAQQIGRNWLDEDRAAAIEQRKLAEAALEKVQAQAGNL